MGEDHAAVEARAVEDRRGFFMSKPQARTKLETLGVWGFRLFSLGPRFAGLSVSDLGLWVRFRAV